MPRLCDAIKEDHRKIEQAYRYILTSTNSDDKNRWKNELALELARHCISEEKVLLPILKDRLADGDSRSTKNHTDREGLKEKISRLKAIPVTDPSFELEMKTLWVDVAAHVRDTDHQDVARLEGCLTTIESEELARQFRETMSLAPTRSNSSGAMEPPSQLITDFLATGNNDMDPILRGCR
ncbi:HHE domain-containing protein [Colletotrichum eremochloae]|uniref:Putative HHE domain-containing protein n=1 Tax=Colletotrichum sublineola TaxID=1173701 RepID=A0A066X4C1_COLSU|nr:HHE domain-containing protein [Colletotrichum sublineola]KAK2011893.1 HHE domain-containing protein [Colletotrichum eremochloae]KDN62529.1 putative HHE domain-containing protein [Colletotrichum sublineola]